MKIKCNLCGKEFGVGSFWLEARCPGCGYIHERLDDPALWEEVAFSHIEVWLCWACEEQFEVFAPSSGKESCPHCGSRNYADSVIPPVYVDGKFHR
jgi:DNA-directed RNA polymerase subunit RPC12/RpoP